jgi:hypothetical protein
LKGHRFIGFLPSCLPQAAAVPVVAGDYTRDIRAGLRQKTLHAAAMKRSRFCIHPAALGRWVRLRERNDGG